MAEPLPHLEIVGPGRAGIALGARLLQVQAVGRLTYTGRAASSPDHPLFHDPRGRVRYRQRGSARVEAPDAILLAVPDGAIAGAASQLAAEDLPAHVPVLHLSGALGSDVLRPLAERGFPTGSLHPLVAFSDADAGEQLSGAWFAVEGEPGAVQLAERLVKALGGRILPIRGEEKVLYHAAAVAASNFVVALLGVAERWMGEAGVPPAEAREALAALALGAVENTRRLGPEEALTGPVSRGDEGTVKAHLARLSRSDRRLYSLLSSSALTLARQRGLDEASAAALARLLEPIE